MEPADPNTVEITACLKRLSAGDSSAESPLADAVYTHLQRVARAVVQGRRSDISLQPTALVNQVLLELIRLRCVEWQDREHFFRVASRLLRRRFIDYIRAHTAEKRGAGRQAVALEEILLPSAARFDEIVLVDEALRQLAEFDPQLAELVEMVYFGGIPIATIAETRNVSEKTVDRHLALAKRWLRARFRIACPSLSRDPA